MDLFGLDHVKVIREPADDTKVLVGWSASTVVLAFRGTNSFTNAKRDAQVDLSTTTFVFPHLLCSSLAFNVEFLSLCPIGQIIIWAACKQLAATARDWRASCRRRLEGWGSTTAVKSVWLWRACS